MNTASRLKTLVLAVSTGLLFVASTSYAAQFTYTPSKLRVAFTTSQGQRLGQTFLQGGKLEAEGPNTNTMNVSDASTGAYGITNAEQINGSSTTVTSCSTGCGEPEEVISEVNTNSTVNGLIAVSGLVDDLALQASAGGVAPYTLSDTVLVTLTSTGVSIPNGNYNAGTKFTVSAPVTIDVGSTPETDTFNGKLVLGELKPITDDYGIVTGTRLNEVHLTGTVVDSAGNTYKIDQVYGQNDLNGITPNQVTLSYVLEQLPPE